MTRAENKGRLNKRDQIVEGASRIFYQRGTSVGVDTLVEEVGVAKMTLYKHFPTKAELIVACLEYVDVRYMARLQSSTVDTRNPDEKILAIFDGLKRWFAAPNFRGCAFVNATVELADLDHPAREAVLSHKHKTRAWIATMVDECGIADSETVARQIMQAMEGAIATALVEDDPLAADVAKVSVSQILKVSPRK